MTMEAMPAATMPHTFCIAGRAEVSHTPVNAPNRHEAMAGMLSAAEMQALDRSRGADFDERFLRAMIQHHRGAVTMVAELFATDGAGQDETIFKFASDVQVDQRTEIARMERMLFARMLERDAR